MLRAVIQIWRANNSVDYIACLEFMFRLFLKKTSWCNWNTHLNCQVWLSPWYDQIYTWLCFWSTKTIKVEHLKSGYPYIWIRISIIRDNYQLINYGYLCLSWISMTELWISIFGYEYLEFTTIVDIHNSVMETIMDIIVQLWISIFAN